MPTYTYACTACNHTFDVRQSFSDDPLTDCPECGEGAGRLRKVIHPVGIAFKGSGFYKTDSRAGKTGSGSAKEPGSSEKAASGSESGSGSGAASGSSSEGSSSAASSSSGGSAGSGSQSSSSTSSRTSGTGAPKAS